MKKTIVLCLVILFVLACFAPAVSAASYVTPGSTTVTAAQLAGTWSKSESYMFGRIYASRLETLNLYANGTFDYSRVDSSQPGASDSGTFSVSGKTITFASAGELNGTHSFGAYSADGKDTLSCKAVLYMDLTRTSTGQLPENPNITDAYKVRLGSYYIGFRTPSTGGSGTYIYGTTSGTDYAATMRVYDSAGKRAQTSAIQGSLKASVLVSATSKVACEPFFQTYTDGELMYVDLNAPKSKLTLAQYRYLEISLNGSTCLFDAKTGEFLANSPFTSGGAVSPAIIGPTAVAFPQAKVSVVKGKSVTVPAVVTTPDGAKPGVTWTSRDDSIAKVSAGGKITGKKPGKTVITATTKDGAASARITVTVAKKAVKVKSVKVSGVKPFKLGAVLKLKAAYSPSTATGAVVKWTSSNKKVAVVDQAGRVKALKKGSAAITATVGGVKKTVTVKVV